MVDRLSPVQRARAMSGVHSKGTKPELRVRSVLFAAGLRFRLHRRDLPGTPDVVLPRHRTVIFVNGCFWHGHECPKGQTRPASNTMYWDRKLDRNIARDQANYEALRNLGWSVEVIWTCSLDECLNRVLERLGKLPDT